MKIEEIPPIENVELEVKIAYGKINQLVDLVNSQQEAIKELQAKNGRDAKHRRSNESLSEAIEKLEKQDLQERLNWTDKRMVEYSNLVLMLKSQIDALEPADDKPDDTHRTVTLRIPKGECMGGIILDLADKVGSLSVYNMSDTNLQKALDEVKEQPHEKGKDNGKRD